MSTPTSPALSREAAERAAADVTLYAAARQPCAYPSCTYSYLAADEVADPGGKSGYTGWAVSPGVPGPPLATSDELPAHDHRPEQYVVIAGPPWPDLEPDDAGNGPVTGSSVRYAGLQEHMRNRTGTVVRWACAVEARDAFVSGFDAVCGPQAGQRIGPGEYECLIDCEGPVVRWSDGAEEWYPGQSCGALDWPGGLHEERERELAAAAEFDSRDAMHWSHP